MPERIRPVLNAMRVRHWSKNLLVFLPLITGHEITNLGLLSLGAVAFITMSLAASAGYLINDLHDVEADRRHPTKRFRPLAAGTIPASVARGMVPVLLVVSVGSRGGGCQACFWSPCCRTLRRRPRIPWF
ncbi:MAG: UbiA family prenyltransferase [Gemmatimonadetes bacterium]|nr:UbiA family prenyltransferase [Gemmatimonadota bacterium]